MCRKHALGAMCLWLLLLLPAPGVEPPQASWWPAAPPLPPPVGNVVRVSSVEELFQAARDIQPGGTIVLADGRYLMPRYFELATDDVTLRSESGDRHRVILDGAQSMHGELVGISNCRGVTIADLTIENIKWNGFKINSNKYATHVTIRNCVIHNIWQRGVKGPAVAPQDRGKFWPTACRIEYCLFYNDRPKQFSDDPADTPASFQGNYIGGIDAMCARQWVIADNVFVGIHGRTGEGRGAVFLWNESQECVVQRNIIVDCDCGICLGNHYRHDGTPWHDSGCVVRNNMVTRCTETGILAAHTRDCQVVHNTVHDPESRLKRLIWVQDDNDGLLVANNLLSGPALLNTGSSDVTLRDNIAMTDAAAWFVQPLAGNLRLRKPLARVTQRVDSAPDDIDRQSRPSQPLPGAHQFVDEASSGEPADGKNSSTEEVARLPAWVEPMRRVHAGFQGQAGYVAQFGDSITYSMAFWSPMSWTYPDQSLRDDDGLPKTPPAARWRDVILGCGDKGPKFANYSGWRAGQLLDAMGPVLEREKPELAVIMIGTNDISGNRVPESYAGQLEQIVERCLTARCVPLLTTIPPRRGHEQAVNETNQLIRGLAQRKQVPLIDLHAEFLRRQPGNAWDGTLISQDGVHPSGGETHVFTEANLNQCGYALRNWITFLMVREVYFRVLHPADLDSATQPVGQDADDEAGNKQSDSGAQDNPALRQPAAIFTNSQRALVTSDVWAAVCSPRVLAAGVADGYSMRTFGTFRPWRDLAPDARAYAIYQYLADTRTGLFHMNVVAEGEDGLSEFTQIRDPVKILNVYGYAYCGILGPVMAGVCEGVDLGPARSLSLPAWNHMAAETFYGDRWHYLDLDVRAVFRRPDGTLASMSEAREDASLWRGQGPLFFPNDALERTRSIYRSTEVLTFHGFHQTGHTMDYVLRPGERFTRWWRPQDGRWHHLPQYNDDAFMRQLLQSPPRGPKPNHRQFTIHDHGNGQFVYEPQLSDAFQDFEQGVHSCEQVSLGPQGVVSGDGRPGFAVFEVRSPYVIVPQVNDLDRVDDDREASVVECGGRRLALSISLDQGLTWQDVPAEFSAAQSTDQQQTAVDLTSWVRGQYGYLLKIKIGNAFGAGSLNQLKISTWVQVAPASLPALVQGTNEMRFVSGDHYGLPTRVVEMRSRASRPEELLKYLVTPPEDYDPGRRTDRIHGDLVVRVMSPPGTKIAWFTATGQFRTHQQANAAKTDNQIAYAADAEQDFEVIYESNIPQYTNHWHYNAAREVVLSEPVRMLRIRYHGDPAVNNFAVYAHCVSDRPSRPLPVTITHCWREGHEPKTHAVTLTQDGSYTLRTDAEPVNESIELAVASQPR